MIVPKKKCFYMLVSCGWSGTVNVCFKSIHFGFYLLEELLNQIFWFLQRLIRNFLTVNKHYLKNNAILKCIQKRKKHTF